MNKMFNVTLVFFVFLSISAASEKSKPGPLVGSTAKFWSLKTLDGKFEKLTSYVAPMGDELRGGGERKVIVMSFFASWCQPCIKEIGELHKLKEEYADKPVQFFLVNLTEFFRHRQSDQKKYSEAPDAREFLRRKGLTDITVLQDPTGRTARAYGVSDVLPRLFVIDKYKTVQMDETGLCSSCLIDDLTPMIEELIEN